MDSRAAVWIRHAPRRSLAFARGLGWKRESGRRLNRTPVCLRHLWPLQNDRSGRREMEPRISVIMAVYNGERYVREAVDSILAQTLSDLELVIVNDGSFDSGRVI